MAGEVPVRGGFPLRVPAFAGAGAAGLVGLSALSAAVAGFHALVDVRPGRRPPPASVVRVGPSPDPGCSLRVTLAGPGADEPGWVGLVGGRGRLLAGPPTPADDGPGGEMSRDALELPGIVPPLLEAGATVTVATDPWSGCEDPLGCNPRTHAVDTDAGRLVVTSAGAAEATRALVFVHGRGGSPATGWWLASVCEAAGWRCVMPAYRNSNGGGPSTGRYLLGGEWVDLAAVLDHLGDDGVTEVVLVGWSMGGNICASYLRRRHRRPARFAHHPRVVGLILDAAALDWGPVLAHVARARRLPHRLTPLAMAYGGLARRVDWRDLNHLADPEHLDLPVLAFHGAQDPVVPVAVSRALAAKVDDIHLEEVRGAGHCRSVNVDPDRYLELLAGFLDRVGSPQRPTRPR